MKVYQDLLEDILKNGKIVKNERTGTGTKKVFGRIIRFDLNKGFPLLTTKKMHLKSILHELIWFISGDTNLHYLAKNSVHIWDEWPFQKYLRENKLTRKYPMYSDVWKEKMKEYVEKVAQDKSFAKKWGDLGPVYGKQWRDFNGFDQLGWVIKEIKNNPGSRRLIVNAWNAPLIEKMALPPCHVMYQFNLQKDNLSLMMYQRSVDTFLGLPFNIASYALLLLMVSQVTNLKPKDLVLSLGDTHLYLNHLKQAKIQINRRPHKLPIMKINPKIKNINKFRFTDFELTNYKYHPAIKARISV